MPKTQFHLFLDEDKRPAKLLVAGNDSSDWDANTLFLDALNDFMDGDAKTLVIPRGAGKVKVYDRA